MSRDEEDEQARPPLGDSQPGGAEQTPEEQAEASEREEAGAVVRDLKTGAHQEAGIIAGEESAPVGATTGEFPVEKATEKRERKATSTTRGAFFVGAGILLSRIIGLLRQRIFAQYFGLSAAGDAFTAAFRIPNFLQNVFGEGALSASFIPVYAGLLSRDENEEAGRVAGAVFTILALVTSLLVLAGVLAAPYLIAVIAPGFHDEKRELTIRLVKILFPGAGLLVLSAWCLGVLNSHRRFFLSYTAPVIWNVAMIVALSVYGWRLDKFPLAEVLAWASVIGSGLQFAVQLPTVLRLVKRLRPSLDFVSASVRTVIRNFMPVFTSRGVVQISAYVDSLLASLLGDGAVQALGYTQSLYTLPVSLFGMSVSAAELPEMSSATGTKEAVAEQLRRRLDAGLRQIAVYIVPSAMGFLALGNVMVGALYRTGEFKETDVPYVWGILAGAAVGLLASTLGRLYASTYYALHDTRTPLRYAVVRVFLTTVLGYLFARTLPHALGLDQNWGYGAAGLTVSAGIAGWVEFYLLRRQLNRRIGKTGLPFSFVVKLWTAAGLSAALGWAILLGIARFRLHPIIVAALVLTPYGLIYFAITSAMGLPEARAVVGRFTRLLTGRFR
ncbi:MAG: murein biosynthesis integral membrane protein MurJ [Acidobacteria bacterium]|nr:murein biosynthesis integral membrane protein MurJ [Acidobacteriota bacterium]